MPAPMGCATQVRGGEFRATGSMAGEGARPHVLIVNDVRAAGVHVVQKRPRCQILLHAPRTSQPFGQFLGFSQLRKSNSLCNSLLAGARGTAKDMPAAKWASTGS